nr:hypothetical protein CFP56_25784 [Quercus suber]
MKLSPVPFRRLGVPPIPTPDARDRVPYPELRVLLRFVPWSALRCLEESRRDLEGSWPPLASAAVVAVDNGLGGKLDTRALTFGGTGKAPMLEVLRTVLPGVGIPEEGETVSEGVGDAALEMVVGAVLIVGIAVVERDLGLANVGKAESVTARPGGLRPEVGFALVVAVGASEGEESGSSGRGFETGLVLTTGNAGKGPVGGASGETPEGRRGMVEVMVVVADKDMIHRLSCGPAQWLDRPCRAPRHCGTLRKPVVHDPGSDSCRKGTLWSSWRSTSRGRGGWEVSAKMAAATVGGEAALMMLRSRKQSHRASRYAQQHLFELEGGCICCDHPRFEDAGWGCAPSAGVQW